MNGILEAEGLRKRFGTCEALDEVSLSLPPGGVTVLLGPNGAGKSTLLRLALGLLRPDAGSLRVLGLDPLREGRELRLRIAYVPDRPDAPGWMTPRELFAFLAPRYPRWEDERLERVLERFRLPLDTRFEALSRGEGAKAMLAAALASGPELVLFDEPFAGLDPVARRELLGGMLAEIDGAAIVATHDLDIAARIADHVVVLDRGRVHAAGSVEEVLGNEEPSARVPERLYRMLVDACEEGVTAA